jgi:hypothetical protein
VRCGGGGGGMKARQVRTASHGASHSAATHRLHNQSSARTAVVTSAVPTALAAMAPSATTPFFQRLTEQAKDKNTLLCAPPTQPSLSPLVPPAVCAPGVYAWSLPAISSVTRPQVCGA